MRTLYWFLIIILMVVSFPVGLVILAALVLSEIKKIKHEDQLQKQQDEITTQILKQINALEMEKTKLENLSKKLVN